MAKDTKTKTENQKTEDSTDLGNEIKKTLTELSDKVNSIGVEFNEQLKKIEAAEKQKSDAKEEYNRCLDKGDESGMSYCLKTIRNSNDKIEKLQGQLKDFSPKVSELHEGQKALVVSARALRGPAENALSKAKSDLQKLEVLISQCGAGLLSQINDLNKKIADMPGAQKGVS